MAPFAPLPDHAFEYRVRVQPHHTDYAGVVWHGTYIAWLEEARVECLHAHGIDFATWVNAGVDLPVIDLSLQYRQPMTLGMTAVVKLWIAPRRGVRLVFYHDIRNQATQTTCVSGQVTLVPVNREQRQILRTLPDPIQTEFERLFPRK
jgi:acyl-CoA thioester hydrolase